MLPLGNIRRQVTGFVGNYNQPEKLTNEKVGEPFATAPFGDFEPFTLRRRDMMREAARAALPRVHEKAKHEKTVTKRRTVKYHGPNFTL